MPDRLNICTGSMRGPYDDSDSDDPFERSDPLGVPDSDDPRLSESHIVLIPRKHLAL